MLNVVIILDPAIPKTYMISSILPMSRGTHWEVPEVPPAITLSLLVTVLPSSFNSRLLVVYMTYVGFYSIAKIFC